MRAIEMGKGERVISKGDHAYDYYVVMEGEVSVFEDESPKEIKVEDQPIGLGELGILFGIPRTATVVTNTSCLFYTLPSTSFLSISSHFHSQLTFLCSLSLFESLYPFQLLDLLQQSSYVSFPANHIIYK